MQFSDLLAALDSDGRDLFGTVSEDWTQGRAVYGGLVAALGNEAMRRLVPADRALRGLETAFVGPLLPGEVRIEAQLLRSGRAVTAVAARVYNGDVLAAALTGIYGSSRPMRVSLQPGAPAGVPRAAQLPAPPLNVPGYPNYLQYFGMKFAEGAAPGANIAHGRSKVYVRHEDPGPLSESHIVALIDCIPPPVLQMMPMVVPASSLTWTLEFLRHDPGFAPADWWRIDTEVCGAGEGYSQQRSLVLDPNGVPCAFSRQLVAVFG